MPSSSQSLGAIEEYEGAAKEIVRFDLCGRLRRTLAKGVHHKVAQEIRMNPWVLFVTRIPDDYEQGQR